jgi:hypothetical protein
VFEINRNYAIGSDELNVTLYKRGENNKYWKPLGYFGTCESALKALVDIEIRGTGLKNFETVVNNILELKELINGLKGRPLPNRK